MVVITCVGIIIYHPAPIPPSPSRFPSPTLCLSRSPSPLKTAAQPEASKAGFTRQSSSRENGCCFQVLFAHLSGGDCSGENGVCGMLVFNIILFKNLHVQEMAGYVVLTAPLFLHSNVFCTKSDFYWISVMEG